MIQEFLAMSKFEKKTRKNSEERKAGAKGRRVAG